MKNKLLVITCLSFFFASTAQASWFSKIVDLIKASNGLQRDTFQRDGEILATQQHIDGLIQELNGHMTGSRGWGTYQFHDYQSYGDGASDWGSVINMANQGHGTGELGSMMGNLSNQFPANANSYNQSVSNQIHQKYYALKSQTVLAARAASQLDYNKIQAQIAYQQMLQQQIEKASDLKAAIDLSNRIQVEGNLINLEILRQVALLNQQQAITEQASLNSALSNAKFLTKK